MPDPFPPADPPTASLATTDHTPPGPGGPGVEARGRVGRYAVGGLHARGGLGEVYAALDTELDRDVALKRLQDRFADHPAGRRRFVAEARLTARLDHPGVVPVYGLVADDAGRPCYAMRLIRGETLKAAIDRFHAAPAADNLAFRRLLGQFGAVCQAVAYAHTRGVTHRDLKPANVMVGAFGETLVVDWGLAKEATGEAPRPDDGGDEPRRSPDETAPGSAAGTPGYMAPEQAAGSPDVGPAADVYALGATLYHLLTGRPPLTGPTAEVLDRTQRGDVPPPRSVALSVPKPLEAVCRKAMAVSPADRYATATDLAADVDRWLSDEPVTCYREPLPARAARSARRHPARVAGAGAVLATGLVGLAVGFGLVSREQGKTAAALTQMTDERNAKQTALVAEEQARGLAEERRVRAEAAEELARTRLADVEKAKKEADAERDNAVAVTSFLENDLLGQADVGNQPAGSRDPDVKVGALLDRAAAQVAVRFATKPLTEAAVRYTLGVTYTAIRQHPKAAEQLDRCLAIRRDRLGPDHRLTLQARIVLGRLAFHDRRYADARNVLAPVVADLRRVLGPDDPDTLTAVTYLGDLARNTHQFDEAERLLREALAGSERAHGPGHTQTLSTAYSLGLTFQDHGRFDLAEPLYRRAVDGFTAAVGPDHPFTIQVLVTWGSLKRQMGHPDARAVLERAYRAARAVFGADDERTVGSLIGLAHMARAEGRLAESEAGLTAVYESTRAREGADSHKALAVLSMLADLRYEMGRAREAEAGWVEVLAGLRRLREPDDLSTSTVMARLADLYTDQGRHAEAEPLLRERLEQIRARFGRTSGLLPSHLYAVGLNLTCQKRYPEAEAVAREGLAIAEPKTPDRLIVFALRSVLGEALAGQGKLAAAEPLVVGGYTGVRPRAAGLPPDRRRELFEQAVTRVVDLYTAWGRSGDAALWAAERAALPPWPAPPPRPIRR